MSEELRNLLIAYQVVVVILFAALCITTWRYSRISKEVSALRRRLSAQPTESSEQEVLHLGLRR